MPLDQLEEVDRYALARYGAAAATVVDAYARYDYPTIFQTINQFTTVDLSAFFADVSKDRLYTFGAASRERRSAQTAMYTIADGLVRLLAPILPVTTDELWRHLPGTREASVHLAEFPAAADLERMRDAALERRWEVLLDARSAVNAKLEVLREQKVIGSSLQAKVVIDVDDPAAASLLKRYAASLPMLFIVSEVTLGPKAAASEPLAEGCVARRALPSQRHRPGRSTRRLRQAKSARGAGVSSRTFRRQAKASACAIGAWTPWGA